MFKIGHTAPEDIGMAVEEFYDENTGMEYEVFRRVDGSYVLGACHDGVGLMTYYDATEKEISELRWGAGA